MFTLRNKNLFILTLIATFFPYILIADSTPIKGNWINLAPLFILQVISLYAVISKYFNIKTKAFRLFWKFLTLALIPVLLLNIIIFFFPNSTDLLLRDFFSLFSYFFIILAIEISPHTNKLSPDKNISSRISAIFFVLLCFSYFVLLPTEFAETVENKTLSSALFHVIITGLIFIKLGIYKYVCRQSHWCLFYGLLTLAAGTLFIAKIVGYLTLLSEFTVPVYIESLLTLLPYCAVIFSSSVALSKTQVIDEVKTISNSEFNIIILMCLFIAIHIAGIEFKLHYYIHSKLQSAIILVWSFIALSLVANIINRRNQYAHSCAQKISLQDSAQHELVKLNHSLTDSIMNSEDKAIVSVSSNAILTTDITGSILSANPAAIQMFQCLEKEFIGSRINCYFSNEDKMHYFFDYKSNVYTLQRKDEGISIECSATRQDGTTFPVQAELQWAEREDHPLIVITFINLTIRKRAEKQALDLKDKFIANISHEFRTPLTIINGILDRYLIKSTSEDEGKELTTAKRNGLRLVRMVEQLLELSRMSDNPKLSIATYRLQTLMSMPIDSFNRLAQQNKQTLTCDIPHDIWLDCDAQAFEKIIFNLIANAIKYTPEKGVITIIAKRNQDSFILDITDTGIGIEPHYHKKIFERFQRADSDKSSSVFGVGIGLSLVSELVKAHHWQIAVNSEYGSGSKFSLTIPQSAAVIDEVTVPTSVSQSEVSSLLVEHQSPDEVKHIHSQKVVLVIEDNLDMQVHIKHVIEQQHHCILATSGELGLTLAHEYLPDLIVCDVMLQGIDGFAVLSQLKSQELTSHIPVIMLTARSDLDSRLHGLNLQADEYLSKPFNQQELLTRIKGLIENREILQKNFVANANKKLQQNRKNTSLHNLTVNTSSEVDEKTVDIKFIEKLEKVTALVYIDTDLGIALLAEKMAMSERQLQRKMKMLLGTTPNNFIKEFRLNKAQLLLQSGAQIGRIALDVGFSSQTYFGRCFKESFSCTPKQYQQEYLQKTRTSHKT